MPWSLVTFVILPLSFYVILLTMETVWSVVRLFRTSTSLYFQNTWEITHTLLIFGVNSFLWLYSSVIMELSSIVAPALMGAAGLFLLRACAYISVFYVKETRIGGWAFAVLNIGLLVSVALVVVQVYSALRGNFPVPNTDVAPYLWPGLVLTLLVCTLPAVYVYRAHRYGKE